MATKDARKLYDEAMKRLFEVVGLRNKLLRRLDMMARPGVESSPVDGFLFEFDTAQARELLVAIDEVTPRINAAMEELNELAKQTASPGVHWQSLPRDWGK